ncbi:MAG: Polysaccharide biosynthesis protein [Mucilaginibacter sp.]|nr:Polysaccharide biosynthesis protein [Mucilaginibacter sp.]
MNFYKKLLNKHTLSLASNAVMPVIGMITVSLLARNLSGADFGNWTLFLITFTLANFFRTGFLQTSVVKFYSGASKERALNIVGSTWYIGFFLTALLGILSLIAFIFYNGHNSIAIIIKWFAIIYFCTLPSSIALWILQAEQRFDRIFILQLIGQGCFFVSVIVLTIIHQAYFQVVIYAYGICAMLTSSFSILSGWAKIKSLRNKSWASIKEIANFGKFSVGTSISSYLLRGSDTFIIKFMFVNPSVVGIYYLPQRLMEVIEIPLRSFIATALPSMSASVQHNDKPYMTYIMKKYAGILTILLIPVSIISFLAADLVIDIIGGVKFAHTEAANVFRIFMTFAILLPVDRFFGITLDILNKPHLNLIKVFLMLIVNIVGDFIGIYFFHNIYGVAVASIFTFLAGVFYGYWILKKHLEFTMADIIKLGFTETRLILINLFNSLKPKTIEQKA